MRKCLGQGRQFEGDKTRPDILAKTGTGTGTASSFHFAACVNDNKFAVSPPSLLERRRKKDRILPFGDQNSPPWAMGN